MIQLVVCDMAGTTVDEHGDVYRALRIAVEETGASLTAENLQHWMGADKTEAIAHLLELGGVRPAPELVIRQFDRFRQVLTEFYAQNPPQALAGVEEAFARLKAQGIKIALTTGFSSDVAESILEVLGWKVGEGQILDAVVTSDEVSSGRPAPFMIHRAMERTGVQDVRTVLSAGDTVVDVLSAHHAGVIPVGVLTGVLTESGFVGQPYRTLLAGVQGIPEMVAELRAETITI